MAETRMTTITTHATKGDKANLAIEERLQLASDGKWATIIQALWGDITARDMELASWPPPRQSAAAQTLQSGVQGRKRHTASFTIASDG